MTLKRFLACLVAAALFAPAAAFAAPGDYFGIQVVDADTGRGVPLVELRTTYKQRYYTDSNGYVAFLEPGLAGKEVWFNVSSWGYEGPQGPFDSRGVALKIEPGKIETIRVKRTQIAERLYRQTGYGIYRDTVLLGKKAPIPEPTINGRVAGSDTVQTAVYKGKMRWFWQDTDRLAFFLGNFSMTGATSPPPDKLDADKGIAFDYFTEKPGGFAKHMAEVDQGGASRPVWVDGLMVVKDDAGRERLLARYAAANKDFSVAQAGLMLYDDDADVLKELKRIDNYKQTRLYPGGHPFRARVGGVDYYYVTDPRASVRVRADFKSASDLSAYEGFTCLKPDSPSDPERAEVDRDGAGKLRWSWRRGVEPLNGRGRGAAGEGGQDEARRGAGAAARRRRRQGRERGRRVGGVEPAPEEVDLGLRPAVGRQHVGRNLVRGGQRARGAVAGLPQGGDARAARPQHGPLQPDAAPGTRQGRRAIHLFRGHVRQHLQRHDRAGAAVRLQQPDVPPGPGRPAAGTPRAAAGPGRRRAVAELMPILQSPRP